MLKNTKIKLSDCCNAPAIIDVDNEICETYVCTECWEPCTIKGYSDGQNFTNTKEPY
jgi:hypothetical protein